MFNSSKPPLVDLIQKTVGCTLSMTTLAFLFLAVPAPIQAQEKEAAPISSQSMLGKIPIWQLKPFDRLTLNDALKEEAKTRIDLEPERLPQDANFDNVDENNYCGQPGLPWPGTKFRRDLWYRFTASTDGRRYEVIGKGISKIEHYEDIIYNALRDELRNDVRQPERVKFDDCLEMLRILQERTPNADRVIFARIRFHAAEARAAELRQDYQRSFFALKEEKQLYGRLSAAAKEKPDPEVKSMTPVNDRIANLCDRWTTFLVNLRRYPEGRRVVARLEVEIPDSEVATKWRAEYDRRATAMVRVAEQQFQKDFFVESLATMDDAITIQPDHPAVRAMMDRIFEKHARLRVAVGDLPGYHSGPAGWSPADFRAADLLHEPLVRVKSVKEGVSEFESRIVAGLDSSDLNRRASIQVKSGLIWPDGKPVTPVDVHRIFADARQRGGTLYHPALEFLLTNIQSKPPDSLLLEFDRPQFQAMAWLQIPFLRLGIDPLANEATSGVGWSGIGAFRVRERRPTTVMYLANQKYLEPGKPIIKQIVEHSYPTPEERFRALENGEVEMVDFVPMRNLPYVKSLKGVKLQTRARPTICLLQLNFRKEGIRSPELRRALAYAINKPAILQRVGAAEDKSVKLLACPALADGFGFNPSVEEWQHDLYMARMLVRAVQKSIRAIPPMTLAHQGNESTRMAAVEIVKQLNAIGLQVTLLDVDERSPDPRTADIRFQTLSPADPILDLVTLLTRDNPSLVENASPRLRRLMVQLLQVPNMNVAGDLVPEIHQALHDDFAIIPLWQWQESYLVSDVVSNAPDKRGSLYEKIVDWKTKPNYPPAFWVTKPPK